jgi:hypothetical protein
VAQLRRTVTAALEDGVTSVEGLFTDGKILPVH